VFLLQGGITTLEGPATGLIVFTQPEQGLF